jgi:hypothetical protein
MTVANYDHTWKMVKQLALPDQLQLLENLTKAVRRQVATEVKTYSIMDLEGLGADVWHDVDVQEYVNQERASWQS